MGLLAGLVDGALGGAGSSLVDISDKNIEAQHRADLANIQSDLELKKMEAAEQFKSQLASQMRQAGVDRVNAAAQGIIDRRLAAAYPDPTGQTTDNQLAQFQAEKDAARAALGDDPHIRVAAAESTGDVPFGTGATLLQKGDNASMTQQWREYQADSRAQSSADRTAALLQMNQQSNETRQMIAALVHSGSEKESHEQRLALTSQLTTIASSLGEADRRKNQLQTLMVAADPDQKAAMQAELDGIDKATAPLRATYTMALGALGGISGVKPVAAPAPAAAAPVSDPLSDYMNGSPSSPADPLFAGAQNAPTAAQYAAAAPPAAPPIPKGWGVTVRH